MMSDEPQQPEQQPDTEVASQECAKCGEYVAGWKRALADYDNLKKELASERTSMYHAAVERTGEQLIPVLDNFDQAFRFKPDGLDEQTERWLQGVLHVRTQLDSVMQELGLTPFGSVGEAFDPHQHDATAERSVDGQASGEILEVQMRGWKRGDRVLRPAKVIVNK